MKFLVDTNIFLEVLLAQERKDECRRFLNWLASREDGIITSFTLHAIEALSGRNVKGRKALAAFLNLVAKSSWEIYPTTLEEEQRIVGVANEQRLDFDDALHYFVSKKQGVTLQYALSGPNQR